MADLLETKPDLLEEELILLRRVPRVVQYRLHCSTALRWADRGVKRGSRVIRLENTWIGGRRYTSREALARFFARLSDPESAGEGSPSPQRERQKAQAAEHAKGIFGR